MVDFERGYAREDSGWRCMACGARFEEGRVYPEGERLLLPERAAREHVESRHGGPLGIILGMGREAAGLTEVQASVVRLLAEGRSDREIAAALGGKSASTVRNHRFQLRRREAEAQVYLALMALLDRRGTGAGHFVDYPAGMPDRDERAVVSLDEAAAIEAKYLGPGPRLARMPRREKEKLVVLRRVACLFEAGRRYSEKEVNAVLHPVHDDHVTLRRYLIEYRFLEREADGSAYWLREG